MLAEVFQKVGGLVSRLRNLSYRLLGMRLRGYVWMRRIHVPRNWSQIEIQEGVALDEGVQLVASGDEGSDVVLSIGEKSYVNRFTTLDAHGDLRIGKNCLIGPYCYLTDADHGAAREKLVIDQPMEISFLHIGDGAWIGSHVVLLPGVTIGEGAIIGAGSVVTRDIPANAIAYGVPAEVQGERKPAPKS